jgi:hypothetical protein
VIPEYEFAQDWFQLADLPTQTVILHTECALYTHERTRKRVKMTLTSDSYTQRVISTLRHSQLWFQYADCDFDTYECDYDTHEYDYDTHECDLYTQKLNFNMMRVTSTRCN